MGGLAAEGDRIGIGSGGPCRLGHGCGTVGVGDGEPRPVVVHHRGRDTPDEDFVVVGIR